MIEVNVEIKNLDELRRNFQRSPDITLKNLSKAIAASIFSVEKQAIDRNFQFKMPRSARSGWLEQSFAFGRYIEPLLGSIGPTAQYAPFVHFGTSRGIIANPFMDRIARSAEPDIQKHFDDAVDNIVAQLAQ